MAENWWRGDQPAVADVWTLTVGGPATGSGTIDVPINGKKVRIAFVNAETAAVIASRLNDALAASSILEFAKLDWTYTAAGVVVTGTMKTPGFPTIISAPVVTAAVGVTCVEANATPASGPNFVSDGLNWSLGHKPTTGEVVQIGRGPAMLFGLASMYAGVAASTHWLASYTEDVGLPERNTTDGGEGYVEFLPRALDCSDGGTIHIGEGADDTGGGPSRMVLIVGTGQDVFVHTSGASQEDGVPAIDIGAITGEAPDTLNVFGGDVGYGVTQLADTALPEANVVGESTFLRIESTATEVNVRGGRVEATGQTVTLNIQGGTYVQQDGRVDAINATGGVVQLLHDQGANEIAAAFSASIAGEPPYLDLTINDRRGRKLATGSSFKGGAYILDPYQSADLQATVFDAASLQASDIGPTFTITRPPG